MSNNQLAKIEQLPLNEIMSVGKAFAESGMFPDIKTAAQAIVKIQAGQEIGIPPFASMTGIHLIQGKPAIGAGLMAARVKGSGKYDYRIIEQTDTKCSIDFYQGKEKIGNSTFTAEDAKKAQTKNMDKFPRNMLFARAMSNGIKWFTPDVFSGPVYTPEELGNGVITEDVPHEEVKNDPPAKPAISEKQFNSLQTRIADCADQDAALKLLAKAQDNFSFSDVQAKTLVDSITILPVPA